MIERVCEQQAAICASLVELKWIDLMLQQNSKPESEPPPPKKAKGESTKEVQSILAGIFHQSEDTEMDL